MLKKGQNGLNYLIFNMMFKKYRFKLLLKIGNDVGILPALNHRKLKEGDMIWYTIIDK